MHVELNALSLRPDGAGVSTYVRELLHAMAASPQLSCTALVQADAVAELPPTVSARAVPPCAGARRAARSFVHRPQHGHLLHGLDVDLPLRVRGPSVTTVHDLSVFDVPWAFTPARARGERALVRHAMRTADAVIAVSEFTAARVKALFNRDSVVTRLAPGRDMAPASADAVAAAVERYRLPSRFVLHVGTAEPRKDVPRLADACREAGLPLLLAGGGPPSYLSTGVRRLGFVPRRDLPALFGAATVTAYVSLYEGFGLPPVEALACGGNVVCTRVADLSDLLGNSVTWVDGDGAHAMSRALRTAEDNARAATSVPLSWADTAARTVAVYRSLDLTLPPP